MSSSRRISRRTTRSTRHRAIAQLEALESRVLLTTIDGITIPNIPGITIPSFPSGVTLPSFTNGLIGSLDSILSLNPNDEWWLDNTGQTLTNHPEGPATGTPGADISAEDAWNITRGSSNVVVAVLDTGFDLNNSALDSVLWTNPKEISGDGIDNDGDGEIDDIHGWNFVDNNNDVQDNFLHGTAVAAAIHSVAPNVTILPVVVGTEDGADPQAVIDGINYLIALKKEGVNIVAINASYISFTAPTQGEITAIKNAGSNGMLYVAAAGNAGMNLDSMIPNLPSQLQQYIPSFLPSNLIFVAATDNQDNLASFSDYGAHTVAVGAPGVDMTLPIPGGIYAPLSGTSFAAPMVSAIAALLKSRDPGASMSQIKDAILDSGDPDPALAGKTITGRRVDALKALNYLIGDQPPTGAVTTLNNTTIAGWAIDPNLGNAPATVQITIDNTTYTTTADIATDAVPAGTPSDEHGFSFDVPTLAYGKHTVKISVLDDLTGKAKLLTQSTLTVDTDPTGAVESSDSKSITGWAFDPDTPTKSIQVKLYLDGKSWMTTTAGVNRPDLVGSLGSANHGYTFKFTLPAGIHRVDVYAVDSLTGALILLGSATLSSNRPAEGDVELLTDTNITGWAYDPDAGSSSIAVRYQIDDFAPVFITANISRPDLVASLGSKNHGFSITLPQLTAGDHTITVDAVDPNNKSLILLTTQTLTITDPDGNPLPTGSVTFPTAPSKVLTGSVTDPNSTSPIMVRVDIDGKAGKPFASTLITPDSTTYNFSYTLPNLNSSPHRIDVYALDQETGAPVLIDSEFINSPAPTGTVESVSSTLPGSAVGYAVAPAASNHIAQIRIDVDGMTGTLVNANLNRPDLLGTLGAANVGFNIKLPDLAPGTHTLAIYLIDPTTLDAIELSSTQITV